MPESINWTLNVQVVGGPQVSASDAITVGAYDKIEAVVPSNGGTTVNVQPGDGAQFLLITASSYEHLTYQVDVSVTPITLDGPHLLIGAGAVSLLGATQNQFTFSNSDGGDITVSVLVGRDAVPTP